MKPQMKILHSSPVLASCSVFVLSAALHTHCIKPQLSVCGSVLLRSCGVELRSNSNLF